MMQLRRIQERRWRKRIDSRVPWRMGRRRFRLTMVLLRCERSQWRRENSRERVPMLNPREVLHPCVTRKLTRESM